MMTVKKVYLQTKSVKKHGLVISNTCGVRNKSDEQQGQQDHERAKNLQQIYIYKLQRQKRCTLTLWHLFQVAKKPARKRPCNPGKTRNNPRSSLDNCNILQLYF